MWSSPRRPGSASNTSVNCTTLDNGSLLFHSTSQWSLPCGCAGGLRSHPKKNPSQWRLSTFSPNAAMHFNRQNEPTSQWFRLEWKNLFKLSSNVLPLIQWTVRSKSGGYRFFFCSATCSESSPIFRLHRKYAPNNSNVAIEAVRRCMNQFVKMKYLIILSFLAMTAAVRKFRVNCRTWHNYLNNKFYFSLGRCRWTTI
jgi:hypothetical protein